MVKTAVVQGNLQIVVALMAEAKPIIAYYHLRLLVDQPYRIYSNGQINLIISGIGKIACAAACGYLHAMVGSVRNHAWLNIGIAGYGNGEIGDLYVGNKIIDQANGQCFYPVISDRKNPSKTIITVETLGFQQSPTALYEMEASGFFATASRFGVIDMIHCLKIISDRNQNERRTISGSAVRALIHDKIDVIVDYLANVLKMIDSQKARTAIHPVMTQAMHRLHFTVSQKHQLRLLVQDCEARNLCDLLNEPLIWEAKTASKLLIQLRESIAIKPYVLLSD